MTRVSISKSYAVLMGMESYTRTKRKVKNIESKLGHEKDKLVHPERVRQQDEQQKDKSQSAEKERKWLENHKAEEEKEREGGRKHERLSSRIAMKLGLHPKGNNDRRGVPGVVPEDGVPPLEGKR